MAVFIKAAYVKKLGPPRYSSQQYSMEVSAELSDLAQLPQAGADLHARLQASVDAQIVNPGFVPGNTTAPPSPAASTTSQLRNESSRPQGDGIDADAWRCSDKQRDLVLKIVDEHRLDKADVDALARQRYGIGVKQLNKLQASGLIDELFETHGGASNVRERGNGGGVDRRGGYPRVSSRRTSRRCSP